MGKYEDSNEEPTTTSCGILFYKKVYGNGVYKHRNIQILMGVVNNEKYPDKIRQTILGGRKEECDMEDEDTAIREFNEESAGIFQQDLIDGDEIDLKKILRESPYFYLNDVKRYRLYIVNSDDYNIEVKLTNVEQRFHDMMENKGDQLPKCMKEMKNIVWVPYTNLFNKYKVSYFISKCVSRNPEIISFFNQLYIETIVEDAINNNKDNIKVYKNMEEPTKQYLERNNMTNKFKVYTKIYTRVG